MARSLRPTALVPSDQRSRRRPGSGPSSRLPLVIVLAALSLVVLVGGVAAYVVLPSVSIVVTPRVEDLALPAITVTADPGAIEPDVAGRVVPAVVVPLEVTVSEFFPVTGKRVEEETANGVVRFANLDFLRSNTIPAGSIVSTNAGVRFRTAKEVTVPRADLVGLTVFPGRINVNVTAVEPGTAGNVEPNAIVIVPQGKDPQALKVVNPNATTGGTHEEFPQVAQEDVDGALEQLQTALAAAFEARLADPSIAPEGATVFGETATLGEATPTVDPVSLVGQEIETFEIGLSATGNVLTVDPAPVTGIADALLRAAVAPGHRLVAGSIQVAVSAPVVSGQSVSFSATATGQQVAVLDVAEPTGIGDRQAARRGAGGPRTVRRGGADRLAGLGRGRPDHRGSRGAPDPGNRRGRSTRSLRSDLVTRRLGIDLGERRIGIAMAEGRWRAGAGRIRPSGGQPTWIATPPTSQALIIANRIDELVIGLPLEAAGAEGSQAAITRALGRAIGRTTSCPPDIPRRAALEPRRRGPARSDETRPVGRAAQQDPTRCLSGHGSTGRRRRSSSRTSSTPVPAWANDDDPVRQAPARLPRVAGAPVRT